MVTLRAASPETTVTDHTTSVQTTVLEKISQKRWHTPIILALRRQKDQESKVIFGYIKSLRLTLKKITSQSWWHSPLISRKAETNSSL